MVCSMVPAYQAEEALPTAAGQVAGAGFYLSAVLQWDA